MRSNGARPACGVPKKEVQVFRRNSPKIGTRGPEADLCYYARDANTDAFIARLSETVSIASISGDPAYRPKVLEMSDWLNAQLRAVGIETRQADVDTHVMDGHTLLLPLPL
ncbi:hypothetical protein B0H19DRAFT_1075892 [Mycena capillaripes]|nr:hypothetical protein B0H19DRAFT_1075892 [Mycena capillaripes]